MVHVTKTPDSAWLPAISSRRVVLWLGRSTSTYSDQQQNLLPCLVARPWHSILIDGFHPESLLEKADHASFLGPLTLRSVTTDPDEVTLASNRIAAYIVPPKETTDPHETLVRLKMFQRIPEAAVVFVLTTDPIQDMPSLQQALQVCAEVREVVIITPRSVAMELKANRVVHWQAALSDLVDLVGNLTSPTDKLSHDATIVLLTKEGTRPVNLSHAIDPSYSILERFEFIPSKDVLTETLPNETLLAELLASPTESWAPYAAGIPFDRTKVFHHDLRRILKSFRTQGADATITAWINAEQASGATTLLRSLLFLIAREGIPILLARPDTSQFDFQQVSSFLRSSSPIANEAGCRIGEVPWVIAFDSEHTTLADDFVGGLANGLKKLRHTALILAIRPVSPNTPDDIYKAVGLERCIGPTLLNTITRADALAAGKHLNTFLPVHQQRRDDEWANFTRDAECLTGAGKQSLFWLTLRFWLFRFPGAEEPLRKWLASVLRELTADSPESTNAMTEVAVLSRYRLAMPARLLDEKCRKALHKLMQETSHPFGLREFWLANFGAFFVLAHPLVGEEILRICAGDSLMLQQLDVSQCTGLLDLELSIFERVLRREQSGSPEVIHVIEEIVTSALRVDPREAPRNYAARERIVGLLEKVPDSIFDGSQVFLHHLAKARRHLAADPPQTDYWSDPASIREQFELAESHLKAALHTVVVENEERRESPLNLHVTLALTYDVRSRFEARHEDSGKADQYADLAHQEYEKAQKLDPDSTYVLENFGRFKLRQARETSDETRRIELLVDAVTLLEWELMIPAGQYREDAILEVLGLAYTMLDEDIGLVKLEVLASEGSEPASVALAQIISKPPHIFGMSEHIPDPKRAIEILRSIQPALVTWRSRFPLYQLVSKTHPSSLSERLEALDELAAMTDFAWPLQTRLEYGIILYQMGRREDGRKVYQNVRDMLASRSSGVSVPSELKYLADPQANFAKPLRTSIVVTNISSANRNYYGIPCGWMHVDIPFRPYLFARKQIRLKDDLDCFIRFTTFGPQAVPPTET